MTIQSNSARLVFLFFHIKNYTLEMLIKNYGKTRLHFLLKKKKKSSVHMILQS